MSSPPLTIVSEALLPSAVVIVLGALWRRVEPGGVDYREVRRIIGLLVLNLFYPALILTVIPTVELSTEMVAAPLLFATGALAIMALLAPARRYLLARGMSEPQFAVLILACAYANIISLGVPLLQAEGGAAATRYAIYVDLLAVSPLFWILGVWIAARSDPAAGKPDLAGFIRTFLLLPPVWVFVLAVALNRLGLQLPAPLQVAAAGLGATTMHAMLLTVGMSLSIAGVIRYRKVVAGAAVLKLLLMPALVLAIGEATIGESAALRSTVLLAATPTMMATMILSERFQLDTEMLAAILVATTALFFLTLPAWLWILG
ncbi:MAG: AEC family transporter [Porticoccaceae bacterium]